MARLYTLIKGLSQLEQFLDTRLGSPWFTIHPLSAPFKSLHKWKASCGFSALGFNSLLWIDVGHWAFLGLKPLTDRELKGPIDRIDMMRIFLIFLVCILKLNFAMKRRPPSESEDENALALIDEPKRLSKRPRSNGNSPPDNQEISLDEFPDDILVYIAVQLLEDYPLRSKAKSPLGYLNALSKRWNRILSEPYFVTRLRSTPNAALHLLEACGFDNVGTEKNWDLLQTAAPIINMNERVSAIVESADLTALRLLTDLPNYGLIPFADYDQISRLLFQLMEIYHPGLDLETKLYFEGQNPFPVMDKMFIFDVPQEIIVKYLIFEDLDDPHLYTWIFNAIMISVCHIYFKDRRHLPKLAQWFKNLSGLKFPYSLCDMTCEILIWPMILATLVEDWEFIDLLRLDYDRVMNVSKIRHANYLARTILKCRNNKCGRFPPKAIISVEFICSVIGDFDFMGFDKDLLKERFRDLLPNFRYQRAIEKIQHLITRD